MHQMAMIGNYLLQLHMVVPFITLVFSANHETGAAFQCDLGRRRTEEIDSALEVLRFRSPPPSSQKKHSNNLAVKNCGSCLDCWATSGVGGRVEPGPVSDSSTICME